MNSKALETILKYGMIKDGDSVCVALSGGADSVSLFNFFVNNKETLGLSKVLACHLNHNLRGEESDRDEIFVRNLCEKHGAELIVRSLDINAMSEKCGKSIEETARDARYELFKEVHLDKNCKIATAHTLSDCMETALFNLARGTGLKGICGITPTRDYIIRPLIHCSRAEIEEYCEKEGLDYVTDSTNLGNDYTRNRIRHFVIPKLYEINPNAEQAFLRFFIQGEREQDFLDEETDKAFESIKKDGKFLRGKFLSCHEAVAYRLLAKILSNEGIDVSFLRLELLYKEIQSGTGTVQLNKDWYLKSEKEYFYLFKKSEDENISFIYEVKPKEIKEKVEFPITKCKKIVLTLIQCEQSIQFENFSNKDLKNCLDCDKISGVVLIRQRKDGDKIALNGRGCTKSLKKLFNEKKIPTEIRTQIPVISSGDKVIWVGGFGSDKTASIDKETKNYIKISVLEE